MNKLLSFLLLITTAVLLTGCSDDPSSDQAVIYNIVRFDSQTASQSTFTYQKPLAPAPVTLTADAVIDTDIIEPGDRLLLAYVPTSGDSYVSGHITVTGYRPINNATLTDSSQIDLDKSENTDPVYLLSAWQAGEYLNIYARLPYDSRPRTLALVRDLDSDPTYPDLYLIHRLQDEINTFERAYYISYDISDLTADPSVNGFTLYLNDSNLEKTAINFSFYDR